MFVTALALVLDFASFTADVAALDKSAPDAARKAAIRRVMRSSDAPAALVALPRLEALARTDPDNLIRCDALLAVGRVAKLHKKPAPEVLFDALTATDCDCVPTAAAMALDDLKPLPPGSTAKLLKVATTGNDEQRDMGYLMLATHAPKDPAALKVLRDAASVPGVMKRHNARCALFRATDKLSDLFPHIMDIYVLRADTPGPPNDAPENVKRENMTLNLIYLGGATILARWTQDRPAELLDEMIASIQLGSPKVRLEVLRQVERFAEALAEPEPEAIPGSEFDPKRRRAGMKAIVHDPAMRKALKTAADKDPSPAVRELAKDILGKKP